jgi:DNA-binding XRE family transcriptional regulator
MQEKRSTLSPYGNAVPAIELATNDPALLKRRELAREINVSVRTVDNLQRKKIIPVIKLSTRCCRFRLSDVLRALERFEVKEATR